MMEADLTRTQARLALAGVLIAAADLDGLLDMADPLQSPQALAAGTSPAMVLGAAFWAETARAAQAFLDTLQRSGLPAPETAASLVRRIEEALNLPA